MKSNKAKGIFALLLSAAMTLPLMSAAVPMVSAAGTEPPAAAAVNNEWTISTGTADIYLLRNVRLSFAEAAEKYTGGTIEPLAFYRQGIVSGCNYYFICRETADDGTVSLKMATVYDPNLIGSSSRNAKARFTSVTDFDLTQYESNFVYRLPDIQIMGGTSLPEIYSCELPDNVQTVVDTYLNGIDGVECIPMAYLGMKNTSDGTDYAVLCCQSAVIPNADRFVDVVVFHQDISGICSIKSSHSIYGQRYVFPKEFKNKSSIENSSIVLGDSVTVNLAAQGGSGEYSYTVSYRKANNGKWIVKKIKSGAKSFSFKPAAATFYEVKVTVDDGENQLTTLYGVSVYKGLINTSTIDLAAIYKGESVVLTGSCRGGVGEKKYAVYYKKQSSKKWSAVQKYASNSVVTVTPKASAYYDICIKVKDEKGNIGKKYFSIYVANP